MKINWKQKLSSRKFWALVAALATTTLPAFGIAENATVQIAGIIGAVGSVAVYILAEAYVDGQSAGSGEDEE